MHETAPAACITVRAHLGAVALAWLARGTCKRAGCLRVIAMRNSSVAAGEWLRQAAAVTQEDAAARRVWQRRALWKILLLFCHIARPRCICRMTTSWVSKQKVFQKHLPGKALGMAEKAVSASSSVLSGPQACKLGAVQLIVGQLAAGALDATTILYSHRLYTRIGKRTPSQQFVQAPSRHGISQFNQAL